MPTPENKNKPSNPGRNVTMAQSPKEILNQLITQRFGLQNAVIMERVLKNQDKQIDQAMLEQGMSANDIMKPLGVDLNSINGDAASNQPPGVDTPPQQNQPQEQPPLPQGGAQGQLQENILSQLLQMTQQPQGMMQGAIQGLRTFSGYDEAQMKKLKTASDIVNAPADYEERQTLIDQRRANTALMNRQLEGGETNIIYRDPVTGEEVSPEQAQSDMEQGLGVYQVNQIKSTRNGIVEEPLNKVPDLTEAEKKYVTSSYTINKAVSGLTDSYQKLQSKYGNSKATWQLFQAEKLPYAISQDQDVQEFKSYLEYIKAQIPFLRGGQQLTQTEAKRVDASLNPFGKSEKTYMMDINRFEDEFLFGADIQKFGLNAGLMKRMIRGDKKKQISKKESSGFITDENTGIEYRIKSK